MTIITATKLARNNHEIASIIPAPFQMTALETMADLYCTLSEDAGKSWLKNSRIKSKVKKEKLP